MQQVEIACERPHDSHTFFAGEAAHARTEIRLIESSRRGGLMDGKRFVATFAAGAVITAVLGGSAGAVPPRTATAGETAGCATYSGRGCAPSSARVDLAPPVFSNPTKITNPLFPISELHSAVLLGHVSGKPFRTETTLLPRTEKVVWQAQAVEVLRSQY